MTLQQRFKFRNFDSFAFYSPICHLRFWVVENKQNIFFFRSVAEKAKFSFLNLIFMGEWSEKKETDFSYLLCYAT